MGRGKRASMREGPLANLFRKTETEGLEPAQAAPPQPPLRSEEPQFPERATPTPTTRSCGAPTRSSGTEDHW